MKITDRVRGRKGAVLSALLIGAAAALLAPSTPAAAEPPGGRCVGSYYTVDTNYGLVHEQVGPTEAFQNASSFTVTWTVSRQVSHTATSTVTVTGGANVGIHIGVVTIGVQLSTSTAVANSMTINTTAQVAVPVPPGVTAFAAWGVFKLHTSGPYTTITVNCDTGETISETTTYIDVYSVTSDQPTEGWVVWN